MSDPKVIYLAPKCEDGIDGRSWCEDDIWTDCEENGCSEKSVRYVLESDAQSELAALREELAKQTDMKEMARRQRNTAMQEKTDLQHRLADAERRNASITELLRQAATYGGLTPLWHDKVQRFIDLTKPEEAKS